MITNYAENKNPRDRNITRSSQDRRKKCVYLLYAVCMKLSFYRAFWHNDRQSHFIRASNTSILSRSHTDSFSYNKINISALRA